MTAQSASAAGYPVARELPRKQAARPRPSGPKPANENLPRPANDNPRLGNRAMHGFTRAGLQFGKKAAERYGFRIASRLVPILGNALTVIDIIQWLRGFTSPRGYNMTGWKKTYGDFLVPSEYTKAQIGHPSPGNYVDRTPWRPLDGQGWYDQDARRAAWTWPGKSGVTYQDEYYSGSTIQGNKMRIRSGYLRQPSTLPDPPGYDVVKLPTNRAVGNLQPRPHPLWEVPPWADPFSMPIGQPVPTPLPVPYRAIPEKQPNPHRSPGEQRQWGPAPLSRPVPWEVPVPGVSPAPRPSPVRWPVPPPIEFPASPPQPSPTTRPVPQPSPFPGQGPAPGQSPNPSAAPGTANAKPGPGTKERKARLKKGGVVQFIAAYAGGVTELLDAQKCAWEALPKEYRPGYYKLHRKGGSSFLVRRWNANVAQRSRAIYQHADKLNLTTLFQCMLSNEVEDRAIGKANKFGQKHLRSSGVFDRPLGLSSGSWDTWANNNFWMGR